MTTLKYARTDKGRGAVESFIGSVSQQHLSGDAGGFTRFATATEEESTQSSQRADKKILVYNSPYQSTTQHRPTRITSSN